MPMDEDAEVCSICADEFSGPPCVNGWPVCWLSCLCYGILFLSLAFWPMHLIQKESLRGFVLWASAAVGTGCQFSNPPTRFLLRRVFDDLSIHNIAVDIKHRPDHIYLYLKTRMRSFMFFRSNGIKTSFVHSIFRISPRTKSINSLI
jgi:hypothetical protein